MNDQNNPSRSSRDVVVVLTEKILYLGLLAMVALLPVFVLPLKNVATEASKVFFVEFLTLGLLIAWLVGQIRNRRVKISNPIFSGAFLSFSLITIISSLLSRDFVLSMFGESFGTSEGLFVTSLGIIGFLAVQVFYNFQRVISLYTAMLFTFSLVLFVQLLRFVFGANFLSLGVLDSDVATLVGGWNDLGLYAGFALLVALVGLEFLKLKKYYRFFLYVIVGFSVFGLLLTNVALAWVAVAGCSFLVFLYQVAFRKELAPKVARWRLPIFALAICLFAISGYLFIGKLAQSGFALIRPVGYNEIRLSLGATASVVGEAWSRNLVTGIGQNHFGYLWQETRNEIVARIPFSDVRFQFGYSALLTFFGTLGVAGGIVLLLIIARFVRSGFRVMLSHHNDRLQRFFTLSAFILALYLWLLLAIYVPGPTLLVYAFVIMGVLAALSGEQEKTKVWSIDLKNEQSHRLFSLLVFLILVLVGGGLYQNVRKFGSLLVFHSAMYAPDIQIGYEKGLKAAQLGHSAPYYRVLSTLVRQQAIELAKQTNIEENKDIKGQVESLLGQSLAFANQAVEENYLDYQNWLILGDTYTALESFDVSGAYLDGKQAYGQALVRNPKAHDVLTRLAILEIGNQNYAEARKIIEDMLARRPNDAQALVTGAQVAYLDGRAETGDSYLTSAVKAAQDFSSIMQIGVYAYNEGRFELARQIFELTVRLDTSSVDAALALAYTLEASGENDLAQEIINNLVVSGRLPASENKEDRPNQLTAPADGREDNPIGLNE